MALSPFISFTAGFIASFLGTLPFGPINLSVVDTTIKKNLQAGLWFALAAAIVEIGQSFVAIHCSMFITDFLKSSPWLSIGIALLFIVLGILFFFKKSIQNNDPAKKKKGNSFIRGILISIVNIQAIPFWIFVLTYLDTVQMIHLDTGQQLNFILLFLVGVALGKFLALLLFGVLSEAISKRTNFLNKWMNKILGGIFIFIGLLQFVQLYT